MSLVYREWLKQVANAQINWATNDIRVTLLMANQTVDVEPDKATVGDFTTLDEFDGLLNALPYPVGGLSITNRSIGNALGASVAVAARYLGDDTLFTQLDAGSRQVRGGLIIQWQGTIGASIPLGYVDDFSPFTANGGDFLIQWGAATTDFLGAVIKGTDST